VTSSRTDTAADRWDLVHLYLEAREYVVGAGYGEEIRWQEELEFDDVTESVFLREAAWVVLSAGFREAIVRKCFDSVSEAFLGWRSAEEIVARREDCEKRALAVFGSRRKIGAIAEIAGRVAEDGIEKVKMGIRTNGVTFLQEFPFVGPVTSYHLAKNLGVDVVKPDRHLVRMAQASGYSSALEMCSMVAAAVGESVAVVDLVFWRYATLNHDYETEFQIGETSGC